MNKRLKLLFFTLLLLAASFLHILSRNRIWIENSYFDAFFRPFSAFLRQITGFFSFSIGDWFYFFALSWMFYLLFKGIRSLFKGRGKNPEKRMPWQKLASISCTLLVIYIIFNLFWGLNYNREGIAWQLGLRVADPSKDELLRLNMMLAEKTNYFKDAIVRDNLAHLREDSLYEEAVKSYEKASAAYPFLTYSPSSIKSSMWGWLGNFAGFTGYYNPFTGEAQVNTTVPGFLHPFVTCHEVAHQLGYAKEMEANFAGYLAASRSDDPRFRYSVYLDLFIYANRDLHEKDSIMAKAFRDSLSPLVKKDLKEWQEFNLRHRNFLDAIVRYAYDIYLKRNSDPEGINSYSKVTAYLLAYYRKTGEI